MYGQLPPNLKGRKAFDYIKTMAKEPHINYDPALTLKKSTYKVTHRLSPQGCVMFIQQLEGIQHQLKEAHYDASVEKLELTDNEIMHFVIKQLRKAGYHPHNINDLEKTWEEKNTKLFDDYTASKYT